MSVSALSATDDQNVAATCELLVGSPPARVNPHPPPKPTPPPHTPPPNPNPDPPTGPCIHAICLACGVETRKGMYRAEEGKTPFPSPAASRSRPAGCGKWGAVSIAGVVVRTCVPIARHRRHDAKQGTAPATLLYIVHFVLFCFWDPRTTTPPQKKTKPNHKAVFSESLLL